MMRRALGAVVAVAAMVGLLGCQPTEPAMTITAKSSSLQPGCGSIANVYGTVSPAEATPKVVLQRTVAGKWQDWKPATTSKVEGGMYLAAYQVPLSTATLHLRVRSEGGTRFSGGVYVSPKSYDIGTC